MGIPSKNFKNLNEKDKFVYMYLISAEGAISHKVAKFYLR